MTTLHPTESKLRARVANLHRHQSPPPPTRGGPPRPPRRVQVFAVGTDWVQITWSALGPGRVRFRCGETEVVVDADGGPGTIVLDDLPIGTDLAIGIRGEVEPAPRTELRARTLAPPPGELLHRIATVSDAHLGSHGTGYLHTLIEKPAPDEPHPLRCLSSAFVEAGAWGADEVIVKGDLVEVSNDSAWSQAGVALDRCPVPVSIVPGNHEWSTRGDGQPVQQLAALGHQLVTEPTSLDRPGLRVILLDSTRPGHDRGQLRHLEDQVADLAGEATTPVFVAMHHQPTAFRWPTYLPPGISGPDARSFLDAVAAASPRAFVTAGHTHRHRRRRHGPVTVTEVGSTKDFPGTWAAYEIYEGGIIQTVRRIGDPSCIRWTDWTRRAALGVWQSWAPGTLADRCFTVEWAEPDR